MFIVARHFNHSQDYLTAWNARWGTVCTGDRRQAIRFATREEAQAACSRAACLVNGIVWRVMHLVPLND